jgi:hypothetical protein
LDKRSSQNRGNIQQNIESGEQLEKREYPERGEYSGGYWTRGATRTGGIFNSILGPVSGQIGESPAEYCFKGAARTRKISNRILVQRSRNSRENVQQNKGPG